MGQARIKTFAAHLALFALVWVWGCCAVCVAQTSCAAQAPGGVVGDAHSCCPEDGGGGGRDMQHQPKGGGHGGSMPCSGSLACPMQPGDVIAPFARGGAQVLGPMLASGAPVVIWNIAAMGFYERARALPAGPPRESVSWRCTLVSLGTMMTT